MVCYMNSGTSRTEWKYEGFWWSESEPHLPMPHQQPEAVEQDFIDNLLYVENIAGNIKYKGYSTCRICNNNKKNGSLEYKHNGYRWPQGLIHYFVCHNVHPTAEFKQFIEEQARNKQ